MVDLLVHSYLAHWKHYLHIITKQAVSTRRPTKMSSPLS